MSDFEETRVMFISMYAPSHVINDSRSELNRRVFIADLDILLDATREDERRSASAAEGE